MLMRPSASALGSLALATASLAALLFASIGPASAQDGAAPGQPAGPVIEPSMTFTDRDKTVAIQLPKDWKSERADDDRGEVAKFLWPQGEVNRAGLIISQNTTQMRAPLAGYLAGLGREVVDGTVESGDGWSQMCVRDEKQQRGFYYRFVEQGGIVWEAVFICHTTLLDESIPVAKAALATFQITGAYEPPTLPDGWKESKLKEFVLWTDADDDNVGEAEKLAEALEDVRKMAKKSLDGDPVDESPALVKVVQNGSDFDDLAMAAAGQKPDKGIYDAKGRAVLMKWMSRNTQGFTHTMNQWAAAQYVHQYFGGDVPLWISYGVRMYAVYGAMDGGKPQKPDKDRMTKVKSAVAATSRKLDAWFTTVSSDVTDLDVAFAELYGWHWFFRHAKQGKKYRKTYEQCLETLRETGDPAAAHAVWADTDHAKLLDDFKKWGDSL